MILGALADYYDRRRQQTGSAVEPMPDFGFSAEQVSFALVLAADGRLQQVVDLRTRGDKGHLHAVKLVVPRPLSSRSGTSPKAYFLADTTSFLLGRGAVEQLKEKERSEDNLDKAREKDRSYLERSRAKHLTYLTDSTDAGALAVRRFFESWDPAEVEDLALWPEMAGATLVFKLADEPGFVHQRPALKAIWQARFKDENETADRQCLVTGEAGPTAALHPVIKGVAGAQPSGAYLVSFNAEAFCSYGETTESKALNAPVSQQAVFAYTAALNELLRFDSPQKLQLGETTVVLWATRDTPYEPVLAGLLASEPPSGLDIEVRDRLNRVLEAVGRGCAPHDALVDLDPEVRFYVLGLAAPSKARLTVRMWLVSTLGQLLDGVARHHADLVIDRRFASEPETPPLWRLVAEAAPNRDAEKASQNLNAGLLHSVLTGAPYPFGILNQVLTRIRAEVGQAADRLQDDPVNHPRAALIKAVLRRQARVQGRAIPREVDTMSLDAETDDVAYRLGRLFAAMEKAQRDAMGQGLNRTIRDSYFAIASSAPRAVFPRLLRLAQHHISKAEYGGTSDRRIAEILESMTPSGAFPAQLGAEAQGRFVLGYYHQRNEFFRKRGAAQPDAAASTDVTANEGAPV